MEIAKWKEKIPKYLKKYKYAAIVLLIGLLLLWLPQLKNSEAPKTTPKIEENIIDEESKLQGLLSKIEGAGRVEVLLTRSVEAETQYQLNDDISSDESSESITQTTVIVTDATRNESGLVRKIIAPVYRGAVVVCDGADNPAVCLSIVDAVSKVTGLSTNHITVLKME